MLSIYKRIRPLKAIGMDEVWCWCSVSSGETKIA